jgi:nitrate/nitrite transporter NarK
VAVCHLDAVLFQKNYGLDLKKSSFFYAAMLFSAMIAELLGGVVTDYLLRRTRNLQIALSLVIALSWTLAIAGLVPAIFVHDLVIGLVGFTVALFFLGFAIAPLWTATMDIAPNYAGSSSALMNAAGAVAGILSPVAFGLMLDRTGSWTTPFAVSVGLLLFAIVMTHRIRPDRPIDADSCFGRLAVAGE